MNYVESDILFSIIVPVYNTEKYLDRCLKSIINQTYSKIEIIVVNDGSTDRSLDICIKYQKMDKRVVVINKENGGLSSARNAGLINATGNYYIFVDSDDYIDLNYCRVAYELLSKNDLDMIVFNFKKVYSIEYYEEHDKNSKFKYLNRNQALKMYFIGEHNNRIYHFAWGKVYKKDIFNDLTFPEGRLHEDLFVTYKIIDRIETCAISNQVMYYYFIRSDSITANSSNKRNIIDQIDAIEEMNDYFIRKGNRWYPNIIIETYWNLIRMMKNINEKMMYKKLNETFNTVLISNITVKNLLKYYLIKLKLWYRVIIWK
jgi:glycosyltransferase involved in cell wall biosynthesis